MQSPKHPVLSWAQVPRPPARKSIDVPMSPIAGPSRRIRTGRAIAGLLRGGWRATPPAVEVDVSPRCIDLLLRSGCAALAWRRIRGTSAADRATSQPLRQAARIYALRASMGSRQLAALAHALRSAGVRPLLFKGWAAARLYAEPDLRPFGDVDLCVEPAHKEAAFDAISALAGANGAPVDLHASFPDLPDRSLDEVFARARPIAVSGTGIDALCPEDHVRCLAVHFFRHGATRPLSLCDVGAAMESASWDFDWDYCLQGNARLTNHVVLAMKLASELLGARPVTTGRVGDTERLPRWLIRAVLRQWGSTSYDSYVNRPLVECLRSPHEVMPALRRRWPSAIQLTVDRHASIGVFPPLWMQARNVASRALSFARRAGRPL